MAERSSPAPKREKRTPHDFSFIQRLTDPVMTYLANALETIKTRIDWQWLRQHPRRVFLYIFPVLVSIGFALYLARYITNAPVESIWLVDSSIPVHTTNDRNDFSTYKGLEHYKSSLVSNSFNVSGSTFLNGMEVYGTGSVMLEIPNWPYTSRYHLQHVLHIPSQPKKISLGLLARAREYYQKARAPEECFGEEENIDRKVRPIYEDCRSEEDGPVDLGRCDTCCTTGPIHVQGFMMTGTIYTVAAYVK